MLMGGALTLSRSGRGADGRSTDLSTIAIAEAGIPLLTRGVRVRIMLATRGVRVRIMLATRGVRNR